MELTRMLRRIIVYGLYLLPLLSLAVSNSLFFPYITGKNFAFRIIVLAIAGCWVLLMLKDPGARPKKHSISFVYLAFIIILALSTIFGVAPHRSFWSNFERMDGLLHYLHLFALYLMAASVFTMQEWKRFFGISIAASVAAMGYAAFQLGNVFTITQGGIRLDSTFGNAIYFGGFMLFNLFLAGYWLREREHVFVAKAALIGLPLTALPVLQFAGWRLNSFFAALAANGTMTRFTLIALAIAVLAGAGAMCIRGARREKSAWVISAALIPAYLFFIYKSGSRGILVGLVLGLLTAAVLAVVQSEGRMRRIAISTLVAALLIIGGLLGVAQTDVGAKSDVLRRLSVGALADTFKTRTALWRVGIEAAKERPILGWGPDTFIMAFSKYYDPELFSEEQWFDRSHNVFVDWFVHTGVLGFAAYIGLFAAAFYTLYRSSVFVPMQKAALAGILVAYIGQNLTVFDNLISSIFFYSLLAFIVSRDTDRPIAEPTGKRTGMSEGAFMLVGIVVAVLTVGGIYGFHIRGVRAASGLIDAIRTASAAQQVAPPQAREAITEGLEAFERIIGYNNMGLAEAREQLVQYASVVIGINELPEDLRIRVATEAIQQIVAETEREPRNTRAPYFLSVILRRVGQNEQALAVLDDAITRSPRRQQFFVDRAVVLNDLGRFDEALATIEQARNLSERAFHSPELVFGIIAVNAGRPELLRELRIKDVLLDNRLVGRLLQTDTLEILEEALGVEIAAGTQNPDRYLQLAEIWLRRGNNRRAIEVLEGAKLALPHEAARFDAAIETVRAGR